MAKNLEKIKKATKDFINLDKEIDKNFQKWKKSYEENYLQGVRDEEEAHRLFKNGNIEKALIAEIMRKINENIPDKDKELEEIEKQLREIFKEEFGNIDKAKKSDENIEKNNEEIINRNIDKTKHPFIRLFSLDEWKKTVYNIQIKIKGNNKQEKEMEKG